MLISGGTRLGSAVKSMFAQRFGKEKLRSRDTFTSVATGLAVVASHAWDN